MQTRITLLHDLVGLHRPVNEVIAELRKYGSDAVDGEAPVTLSREQAISVLQRFLDGGLSARDVYEWADALELREDVDFGEEEDEGVVFDVIANISTTWVLKNTLTPEEAKRYIQGLKQL